MSNKKLNGMIALTRMTHVIMEKKGKSGMVRGLFIPIDVNYLETQEYENKDGKKVAEIGIPVSIVIKSETDERGQDGFIGKNIPGKIWKEATDEQKEKMKEFQPILGNLKDWSKSAGAPAVNDAASGQVFNADEDDDLPF